MGEVLLDCSKSTLRDESTPPDLVFLTAGVFKDERTEVDEESTGPSEIDTMKLVSEPELRADNILSLCKLDLEFFLLLPFIVVRNCVAHSLNCRCVSSEFRDDLPSTIVGSSRSALSIAVILYDQDTERVP